jgi:hypothetical protein
MLAWIRVACVAVLLVATGTTAARADDAARSFFDRRVDALTRAQLLTLPPSQLVDPIRQRAARTITDVRQGCSFGWALAQIGTLWWLWTSGRAARVRDWLRRRFRNRVYERFGLGVFVAFATRAAALIFAFVSYRIGFNVGLTEVPMQLWLLGYALGALEIAFFTGLVFAYVLWLVDRTRLWYVITAVTIFAVAFAGAVLGPLASGEAQYPFPFAAAAAPVFVANESARTRTLTARTEGIGPTTRIVIGDVLVAAATPAEVVFAIAHESAHVRLLEARADRTARVTAPDIAAGVRYLVRRADHDMEPLCYRRSTNWYFADDVALGTQIAMLRGTSDPCWVGR